MSKVVLATINNLQNENSVVTALNSNSNNISTAIENTLSRDGTSPNQMNSQLDMNSNRIINLVSPISVTEPVSLGYLNSILAGGNLASGLISGVTVTPYMQGVVGATNAVGAQALLGVRTVLTADANYYVSTTGSDSNNGLTTLTPFQTIQKAVDVIFKTVDLAGFNVTINLAAGAYSAGAIIDGRAVGQTGNSMITILGNAANPVSTIIATTSADGVAIDNGAKVTVSGVQPQTVTGGNCFSSQRGSHLILKSFGVGNAAGYHILTAYNSLTEILNTTYYASGDAQGHWYTTLGSVLLVESNTINLTSGARTFPIGFLIGAVGGYSHVVSNTFTGTAIGYKAYMYMNHVYSDAGAQPYSYLPGSIEPYLQGGAVYNNDYEFNSWGNWSPTIATVSGTSATANGQYKCHGKDLHFTVDVVVSAAGTSPTISIPFPTANNYFNNYILTQSRHNRTFSALDISTGFTAMNAYVNANSSVIILQFPTGGAFIAGHTYTVTGTIELI